MSEYEKQRLARIAENRARMEALGLPKMASSLMGSAQNSRKSKGKAKGSAQNSRKSKGKAKVTEEDEDYRPQEEEPVSSSSEEEENNDDEDYLGKKTSSGSNKREVCEYLLKYLLVINLSKKVTSFNGLIGVATFRLA